MALKGHGHEIWLNYSSQVLQSGHNDLGIDFALMHFPVVLRQRQTEESG